MKNTNQLDSETKLYLQNLLDKDKKALSVDDIAFLLARQYYLTEDELKNIPEKAVEAPKVIKWKPKTVK